MSRWPGVSWVWFPEVDSAHSLAERLLAAWLADAEGELPATVICADRQWAGRGRGRRVWQSPFGGVYVTFLASHELAELPWLPLAAGVALWGAVHSLLPSIPVVLKWPNDLFVNERKLAGILCTSRVQGQRAWAATSFGLNVLVTPTMDDEEKRAVSLMDLGFQGSLEEAREELLNNFVATFPELLRQTEMVRQRWLAASMHRPGDRLLVRTHSGIFAGEFFGLSHEGLLLLKVDQSILSLAAGELV